ncbi:MAG: GTP 3',8-cyclase MoaA [Gammaproteobacteria bacterium]|nr:GTP 3',8-cyclase MoaA [Gammaproteobacteria bacterium]
MEPGLVDAFNRRIEYVRLSVTDRCDLRCSYCLPPGHQDFMEPAQWLTFDEIERVIRAFTELGVYRVRLTGGEPLTRHKLPELAARLNSLPRLEDLSLSTNGVQLRKQAGALREAGVKRINVSLDSLQPARFAAITGGGKLEKVIEGLTAARQAGLHPVKINMVVMNQVNDDEVEDMVRYCIDHDFTLRLIETMPMGDTGRSASSHYLDLEVVQRRLEERFDLVPAVMPGGRSRHPASRDTGTSMYGGGPARYVQVAGTNLRIGFIAPISRHFCESCNRVRLSADGALYLCLGQEDKLELRPLLRKGISDEELKDAIRAAIARKPERHEFREQPRKIVRFMSRTGG